ncbi:hypothetical protein SPRG_13767 [Saprolegnia parasitica CBS 223.65]|uniref:Uncharacterized protein n=1 Tax=Saprolegnia parasitica (strain CBS 223.65) TaxID=695850 RepID=A0A067BU68_SAPPC|nr:hypothetical protein SPRG_13767 [Saprolegnia parasitica CBS 223.65]KDO20385.1 hypothetical protein SPRG_13767 [Saprolegnia parasitica CBS 223.65]|eukprot:XP_012208912.1 hypothetical protein SPRG_13767 [Saprolegnia parasitica CBS 223.65]
MSLDAFGTIILRLPTPSPSSSSSTRPSSSTATPAPSSMPTPHAPDANSPFRAMSTDDYSQYRIYFDGASSESIDGSLVALLALRLAVDMLLFWDA